MDGCQPRAGEDVWKTRRASRSPLSILEPFLCDFRDASRRTAKSSVDSSKNAQLVRYGAYLFVWVIGLCALVKLLTDFSTALKPLVLAMLVASILEWMVQMWEYIFWKVSILLSMLLRKSYVILRISWVLVCGLGFWIYSHSCKTTPRLREYDVRGGVRPFLVELCDWKALSARWHGSYAGQNGLLRFLAVSMTLTFVALGAISLHALLMSNVSSMLTKLNGYKNQLVLLVSYIHDHLSRLPDAMPTQYQNQTREALQHVEEYLGATSMIHSLESYVTDLLQAVLAQTESVAVGAVFFFLYTFLWLFVPVHLNSHEGKAKTFKILHFRPQIARSTSFVPGEDAPTSEVQQRIYRVVWQYFLSMVVINTVYGVAVFALLSHLGVDMSVFIAMACFVLSFIPELGTIICTILPIPIVALEPFQAAPECGKPRCHDAGLESPFADWSERSIKMGQALLGMVLIKLLVANVLTSIVMGKNRTLAGSLQSERKGAAGEGSNVEEEEVKETHPVLILFFVVLSGEIWGAVGMLISVPVISLVRLALNVWYLEEHAARDE